MKGFKLTSCSLSPFPKLAWRNPLLWLSRTEVQVEGFGQVDGTLVRRELMNRAPEIQHVAGGSTRRMEALEHVLPEVDGEAAASIASGTVDRAWSATLMVAAT
jgi:hypothetical protein